MTSSGNPRRPFKLINAVGPKMIVLPIRESARGDGKWAKARIQQLLEEEFCDTPTSSRQLKDLVRQTRGWTAAARKYAKISHMLKAGVLVDDPREGVDAFYWYMSFDESPELNMPEGVADFDIHATPLVAPRETAVIDLPAGPTGYSYSQRQSTFNGHRAITRNIEFSICLPDYGSMLVFHYQWADPANDRIQPQVADKFARMIEVSPLDS